ncbi:MAG: helix-turn-helix domain-containing protein [Candidatus Omnitrophota bacterium]|nr:helix-turn-helix domain-containing protein [Candidatus Omnitrophota bacterium]
MAEKFISVREAAQILGVTEKKILDLAEEGKIPAYRIAGQYLRFKENEIEQIHDKGIVISEDNSFHYSAPERFRDFIYYNDFYIVCAVFVFCLLAVILFS